MANNKIITGTRALRRSKPTPSELVKRYQRVRYAPMGRNTRDGLDCWGFIKAVVKDVHDIEIPDKEYNLKELLKTANDLVIDEGLMNWVDEVTNIKNMKYGDFIGLPIRGLTLHGGICLGNGKFMHMTVRNGIVIGDISALTPGSFKIFRIKEDVKPAINYGVNVIEGGRKERGSAKKDKDKKSSSSSSTNTNSSSSSTSTKD